MKLILVRHGETIENKLGILQGQRQGRLTERGISQANRLADFLTSFNIDICFTSDLQRATDTANIIALKNQGMNIEKDVRLRERYLGTLQGKPVPDNWNSMNYHESAESMEELIGRVRSFLSYIQSNYRKQTILIVSHGITLKAIISVYLGYNELQFGKIEELNNCSVSVLEKASKDSQFNLIDINNTSYIQ